MVCNVRKALIIIKLVLYLSIVTYYWKGIVMKKTMSATALTQQQQRELDSLIEFINEFIERLKSSKEAMSDFYNNCNFCLHLRKQRKTFVSHTKMSLKVFPTMSETQQVNLELHYFKAVKELKKMLPSAEAEINRDYIFPINWIVLRELKKTVTSISAVQQEMSQIIYQDHSQEILSNSELYNELVETWADLENN